MHQMNLAGVDLNLLPALEALLRLRNVTRAASEVGLSQPAMSRALARLRDLLGDPLLVRIQGGYALTPRALDLESRLAAALGDVRAVLQQPVFDPARVQRTIRIASSDLHNILIAPPLVARLAREAPGIDLRMEAYSSNIVARMEAGTLDLAFATSATPLPPGAASEIIASDHLALVMRRGHPAEHRAWTLSDYASVSHVGISLIGDGSSDMDALLAAAGVRRRIVLVTPQFYAALEAVAATDLVTTISRSFASRFAKSLGLVLRDAPFAQNQLQLTQVWTQVRTSDPLLAWLRQVIGEIARNVHDAAPGLAAPRPSGTSILRPGAIPRTTRVKKKNSA